MAAPRVTSQAVWRVVEEHAGRLGLNVSPRDLQNTPSDYIDLKVERQEQLPGTREERSP
ncbi:MAG: hypothetical protein KJ047_01860 [Anaerolineae bacterium]|nr:hypothetical protein [Anaerolineae bacterium]